MVQLTKLHDEAIVVNADLIEFVESTPDTLISMTTGKKLMVKSSSTGGAAFLWSARGEPAAPEPAPLCDKACRQVADMSHHVGFLRMLSREPPKAKNRESAVFLALCGQI
jgi:hypothetical protein